ncbi:TIGR03619 family F420-dependent LLM class oxidoreductase [Deltaproteobacteria bacterium]|nr:TIGR03619 family F420-dependent LLM class oxidoreductase [Deltaproteobacteria bacterium]
MPNLKVCLGIFGLENFFDGDFSGVIDLIKEADQLGIHQMSITDHVVMGERTDRYPYGEFPVPPEYDWFEPMTTMAVIAGATSHIRLSTSIMITPLRSTVLLAKSAATLDVLSQGRLDLGVGTGWQREEYDASMLPFKGRGQRLEDQLRACQVLWRDAPASFESETVSFDRIYCRPSPRQDGGIPIWFGLPPKVHNASLMAELGVGWIPITYDLSEIGRGVAILRKAFTEAGREPAELKVRAQLLPQLGSSGAPDIDKTLESVEAAIEAGVTHLEILPYVFCSNTSELQSFLKKIFKLQDIKLG